MLANYIDFVLYNIVCFATGTNQPYSDYANSRGLTKITLEEMALVDLFQYRCKIGGEAINTVRLFSSQTAGDHHLSLTLNDRTAIRLSIDEDVGKVEVFTLCVVLDHQEFYFITNKYGMLRHAIISSGASDSFVALARTLLEAICAFLASNKQSVVWDTILSQESKLFGDASHLADSCKSVLADLPT